MLSHFFDELKVTLEIEENNAIEFRQPVAEKDGRFSTSIPGWELDWGGKIELLPGGYCLKAHLHNRGKHTVRLGIVRIQQSKIIQPEMPDWRVFLDAGECAWCGVKRLSDLSWTAPFDLFTEQRRKEPPNRDGSFHRSSLQMVLYEADQHRALLWGFLRQRRGYNGIDAIPQSKASHILESISAWQMLDIELKPGDNAFLDDLVIIQGEDPLELLENYAELVQAHHGRRFEDPPIVGMMTWYGYRTAIDRDIVLHNAELVAELFAGYPQPMRKMLLLDHGWQPDANWGYWEEADRERFPEGMQWLADQIRQRGMELALWYTPFCMTENCPEVEKNQPLLMRDNQAQIHTSYASVWGQLPGQTTDPWPIHFFDGALGEVQSKWGDELSRMRTDWGSVYWKLDFFGLFPSAALRLSNPPGELYARTYATFRNAVGNEGHLAPCSCDTNIQLGYNDSIRIAADIGNAGTWPKELGSYSRGLSTIASLWYKHRRFWVNDPDSIQVGCGCGLNEARVRATVVAFSGGHLMVSEDLRWISPERIEIVRRLLPAYGQSARPLDLFEHPSPDELPRIWQLPIESDWGACPALALFNLTSDALRVTVMPEWFGLKPGIPFGAVEWWQQRWLGRFDGPFEVSIPPADVAVVHAQAFRPYPWLVSVSHHFTGGWIVENLRFDPASQQLRGDLVTRPGLSLSLVGTLPYGWVIPSNADYHGRGNGAGGWAHEVKTTAARTSFTVQFADKG